MKRWTIAAGESPRVYLINDGRDAVGEIVFTDTRRPEDARLIAAAPDLLDALYLALPFVEDHEGSEIYKPGAVADAIRKIRAAIDKAEGVRS
jgi:hypothetical protein